LKTSRRVHAARAARSLAGATGERSAPMQSPAYRPRDARRT
jgi:hypothetical protein